MSADSICPFPPLKEIFSPLAAFLARTPDLIVFFLRSVFFFSVVEYHGLPSKDSALSLFEKVQNATSRPNLSSHCCTLAPFDEVSASVPLPRISISRTQNFSLFPLFFLSFFIPGFSPINSWSRADPLTPLDPALPKPRHHTSIRFR